MVLIELFGPKPIDFKPNFSIKKDIPYGCQAMGKMLSEFTQKGIAINKVPLYNLDNNLLDTNRIYLIITDHFSPDELDYQQLKDLSAQGNHFLIASFYFSPVFLDSLQMELVPYLSSGNVMENDTSSVCINHPANGKMQRFTLKRYSNYSYFDSIQNNHKILGTTSNGKPNLIQIPNGKGSISLSCEPLLFTNYYFAYQKHYPYTELLLNHFPDYPIVWDEYYKPNKTITDGSPVRFILKNKPLRTGWYLLLLSLFVYLLFGSRRIQRKIPIIQAPRNASLDFTRTLGQLYFNKGASIDLVKKKMQHLQSFLHQKFYINKQLQGDELYAKIAAKSGVPQKEVTYIFNTYNWIIQQKTITDTELNRFITLVNDFYKKCT
jgi:hypothetical protein